MARLNINCHLGAVPVPVAWTADPSAGSDCQNPASRGGSWQERQWWVVAAGGDLPAGTVLPEGRPVDVAPTVLRHLGVPAARPDELDGLPWQCQKVTT